MKISVKHVRPAVGAAKSAQFAPTTAVTHYC